MRINDTEFNAGLSDIIEELRAQLQANNIPYLQKAPKQSGNSLQVQCVYHGDGQERKPSAGIRMTDGMYHCFACGEVHTLPEVISHCFGKDDVLGKYGWQWLLKNFATMQIEERKDIKLDVSRGNSSNNCDNVHNNIFVPEKELIKYRWYHPYWTKRGITDDNIIELFDLGYDEDTNCITFPVRDIHGNCLFVARRNVSTKFFQYPEGVKKPLYGLYELSELSKIHNGEWEQEVWVTESMIDCILLWQAGYYAVALNGTGNELQINQLKELPCRHLIICTDNDNAGRKARLHIQKVITNKIITYIQFPPGIKDIGECTHEQIQKIKNWETF